MKGLFAPIAGALERLGISRRVLVLLVGGLVVVAVWVVGQWASTPAYVTLFGDLEFNETAGIEETLKEAGVPYRLGPAGSEVLVPMTEVARARVALARGGLMPGTRPGLELFDKPSWGMTDFAQRVTFQRALEGELARTIAGIRGVDKVQVHLAIPTPSPIRDRNRDATASVVLTLKPGARLSQETIQGITYVVSNSVEQLAADNVAVMDDGGSVLTVPATPGASTASAGRQLEMQRALEEGLVAKINDLLEPVLGAGKVRAQVSAELSFDRVDRTVEAYGATDLGGGAASGGMQSPPEVAADAVNSRELKRSEESVGKILRLTAAVLIDQAALAGGAAGDSAGTGVDTAYLQNMIADAIGVDPVRGDRLTVAAVPFGPVSPPAEGEISAGGGPGILVMVERFARPAIGLVALIILVVVALRTIRVPAGGAASGATPAAQIAETTAEPAEGKREDNIVQLGADSDLEVVREWLKQA